MNQLEELARRSAEEKVNAILDWDEKATALLFVTLRAAGWDTDKARRVLRENGWLLA